MRCRYTDAKIVDVRHQGQPHGRRSIQRLLRTHLVRCEPLDALNDSQYFVHHVERLEAMAGVRIRTLQRLQRGRPGDVYRDNDAVAEVGVHPAAAADAPSTGASKLSRSRTT